MTTAPNSPAPLAPPSPSTIRDNIARLIRADLVGPLGGDTEELEQRPGQRYIVATLAPRDEKLEPEKDDEFLGTDEDDEENGPADTGAANRYLDRAAIAPVFGREHGSYFEYQP